MTEEEDKVIEYWAKMTDFADDMMKSISKIADKHSMNVEVRKEGGSIILTPIEKKEDDLLIDTPCMVSHYGDKNFILRYYAGNKECYDSGNKSDNFHNLESWNHIIPFDKFDPNNIEESLKHNIVNNGNH